MIMEKSEMFGVLILELKRDEGLRLKPYKDTVGKLTIGVGRNLDDVGISEDEAMLMLENDLIIAFKEAQRVVPDFLKKPQQVQRALVNMIFNMGTTRFLGFAKMLDAIDKDDFKLAAQEALDSKWASQVGPRAIRIARLFEDAA
jgi:lysozyme